MNTSTTTAPAKTFKEKVLKEGLTHQGTPAAVGSEIEVTARSREFLQKKGFIAGATDTAPAASKPGKNPASEA